MSEAFDQLGEVAERKNSKLRIAISGLSGNGKTFSSLILAGIFAETGKILVADSENGSSTKCAGEKGIPKFRVLKIEDTRAQGYVEILDRAAAAGVEVLVLDSLSHSWIKSLEVVDQMSAGSSKFTSGWKHVSPQIAKLYQTIISFPGHVIATMREKDDYSIEKDSNGKAAPKKLGTAPVVRQGTEYEFDVVLKIVSPDCVEVTKTRCSSLAGQVFRRDDFPKIGALLKEWLNSGAPLTAADAFGDKIRRCQTSAHLTALMPELQALPEAERAKLRDLFRAKKAELAEIEGAAQ